MPVKCRAIRAACTTDTGVGDPPTVDMGAYEFQCVSCDLNVDGAVSTADQLDLLGQWGSDPGGPPDFDGDGNVGTEEIETLLDAWGSCLENGASFP
ncbi:MAG: hypothetical protein ACYS0D_06850 [Planctomycetota bacterium]|jgi:hypothetical protein